MKTQSREYVDGLIEIPYRSQPTLIHVIGPKLTTLHNTYVENDFVLICKVLKFLHPVTPGIRALCPVS